MKSKIRTFLRIVFYILPLLLSVHLLLECYAYEFDVYSNKDQVARGKPYVTISVEGKRYRLIGENKDRYVLSVHSAGRILSVDISLFDDKNINSYIKKCKLIETEEGISFIQPEGYLTFIPRAEFQ
ncbi:hypothetical protein [Undibacterium pigrum]|uniref:Uncharacterized protein n=1 Tax=Undibacterium pigrum TaxID=401470 RepID=A0A318J3D9_9BURK|nr:hypothetical protein [Undibacterium pigrum]PXX33475.1 hypothetical protein DFR42_1334 [Undibacterium pigrum]